MKGLYIHIPFCKQICSYCDFPKMVSNIKNYDIYIDKLIQELDSKESDLYSIDTIYIGGGTPNLLSNELLEKLFKRILKYAYFAKEVSIECNPDLITEEQAILFEKYKINRVSMGVETTNQSILNLLYRKHTKEDVIKAIDILRRHNINNINLDFIFGLPNQTITDLKNDLDFYYSLKLNHASFYSLILEDKTILAHKLEKNEIVLPNDELTAKMYDYINFRMKDEGYKHYEISNYAKDGYESIHNLLYWNCSEYVAVGMGASGYIKPYRYTNYKTLTKYLLNTEENRDLIDFNEEKKEYLLLGLRKLEGVSISLYEQRFKSSILNDFNLKKYLESGLLKISSDHLFIPEDKMFISNQVFMEFV